MEYRKIQETLEALQKGTCSCYIDDKDRKNEGNLMFCTSSYNRKCLFYVAYYAKGLICIYERESS